MYAPLVLSERVRLSLLIFCALGTHSSLLAFTIIDNFWEIHGNASGKTNLSLFDLPETYDLQEQLDASYSAGLETYFYLGPFALSGSGSYSSSEEGSFDEVYLGWTTNLFDLALGKQRTVWGFGSFFHPSYALELKDGENAELPSGATLWSSIINIPFKEAQLSLFGYFPGSTIEKNRDPTWGGGSGVFQTGFGVFETSFSGSVLAGRSINNKVNLAAEMRIDLGAGYILTSSFGNVINLESLKRRYTPSGLLGISFSSPDGKQQFTIESYYDKSVFLASRLSMELLAGFTGSVLAHIDMENRGIRLSTSLSFSSGGSFFSSFNIAYFNGHAGSHFDNHGAPLLMKLSFGFSF